MELREQLEICRKCTKRELNTTGGIACSLTHSRPDFETVCNTYVYDVNEPDEMLNDSIYLSVSEIKSKTDPEIFSKLQFEQKFPSALLLGCIAGLLGSILWAFISILTGYQIGYMAVGIGALVGFTIRYFGKGFEMQYALLGAIISLLSCLLGNLLSVVGFAAKEFDLGYFQIIGNLNFSVVLSIMTETFTFIDLVFYGIAIYEGYRFATLKFTERSLWLYTKKYT